MATNEQTAAEEEKKIISLKSECLKVLKYSMMLKPATHQSQRK